jgi:hypothetical protein
VVGSAHAALSGTVALSRVSWLDAVATPLICGRVLLLHAPLRGVAAWVELDVRLTRSACTSLPIGGASAIGVICRGDNEEYGEGRDGFGLKSHGA